MSETNYFKCPNCKEEMILYGLTIYNGEAYDKWTCPDCSHIIILDWRSELNE